MNKEILLNGKIIGKKYGVVLDVCTNNTSYCVSTPSVIFDCKLYHMWYSGYDGKNWKIHYATSEDGVTWEKQGVVIDLDDGSNELYIHTPFVIYDGSTYKMWYGCFDGKHYRIHYATSKNGVNWEKHGVVVDLGDKGDSDDRHTLAPFVIHDGSTYKMWYNGHDGSHERIHYAISKDGINWDKQGVVVPLGDKDESDEYGTSEPLIIKDGSKYHMWYIGYNGDHYRMQYATSKDGKIWKKHGVIIPLGDIGESDHEDIGSQAVIKHDDMYKIWYSGYNDKKWRIHYAELYTDILESALK